MTWLVAVFVLLMCASEAESKLTITVLPPVTVGLIRPLVITCTFSEGFNTIGYKPYDIQLVNGKNTVLATISRDKAPEVKNGQSGSTAEGQLVSAKSDAYLKVAWKRPSKNLSGNYTCLAHARNDAGQETLLLASQVVVVKIPQLKGLLTFLHDKFNADDIALRKLENKIDGQVAELKAALASLRPHVEEGYVGCGDSNTFRDKYPTGWSEARERRISVTFQTPYDKPPIVNVRVGKLDIDHSKPTRFYYSPRDVTTKGFTMVCGTWLDTHIWNMEINWYAVNK